MIIQGTRQLGSSRRGISLSPFPEIRARENRLSRKLYYIFDSYQFTVNGSNFNLTGPIRKISNSEKNALISFGFENVDEWYRSAFLNFLVVPQEGQIGPPGGPFSPSYSWNIFYFNFNDLQDVDNGVITFYYSNSFPTRKNLEEVETWTNGETHFPSNTITFTLK